MTKTRIQYIKEAAKKLVDSKLQRLNAAKTQEIFQGVMQTVGLESLEEVYLFVAQFDLTCRDRTSNMDDLSSYFECSSLDMLEFIPALKSLERKGLLVRRYKRESNIFKQQFVVSDVVMADIIDNRPVTIGKVDVGNVQTDKYEFCKSIAEKADDDEVVTDDLILFTEKQEQSCAQLPFVKKIRKDVPGILDRILFYDMCRDNFENDSERNSDIATTMKDIFSNIGQRILTKKAIMEKEHILIKLGLVEIVDDDEITLTDEGKEYFYAEDILAFCKPMKCDDIYAFIEKVYVYFHSDNYNSSNGDCMNKLIKTISKLENANKHIPEVKRINNLIPNECERVLFYSVGQSMIENDPISLSFEIQKLYPVRKRKQVLNDFMNNKHSLQKTDLVEIEKTSSLFGENTTILLTDKGKEALLGEDAALYIDNVSDKQLLACDKIAEKKLFFSGELKEQLSLLSNSLSEEHYKALCSRLEENRLPKGIAVLLYGEPGTGKTESVMQIARATGRAIMHVDISATKTCWFGESEKLIKKVFTDYRRLCEKSKICPILLFNEADAVFSKRKDAGSSSVAQTENAIQNIILEEMEKLDGILIATTNLADNLDRAFERRFLFKIRFDKPTIEAKTSIWMNKLPDLSAEDAHTLASSYDFSGGQIDNITRKALMQEIIKGEKPTLNNLVTICSEENISRNSHRKIGYLG
ncbi:ATP-binding protein [uncultured Prevotella sp.]|uniref:ATP-binding protein n=1 Tax=uncultured Prevotella sp. TaxID=159272 RepID=UPI00261ED78D|nr:ATP-binding protein [uncultured Prevotella sp.]